MPWSQLFVNFLFLGIFDIYLCFYITITDNAQQAESERALQQCYFLLQHALDADEEELKDQALQLYTQAVEFAVTIVSFFDVLFYIIQPGPFPQKMAPGSSRSRGMGTWEEALVPQWDINSC